MEWTINIKPFNDFICSYNWKWMVKSKTQKWLKLNGQKIFEVDKTLFDTKFYNLLKHKKNKDKIDIEISI